MDESILFSGVAHADVPGDWGAEGRPTDREVAAEGRHGARTFVQKRRR